jgi:EAL domain-containing protein (putative c-di-GMP-specific phosphodiesterase class I)
MAAGHLWNAYQPKLDIASGRIVSVEALVRWHHADRGPIGPDRFIPLVEEHGRARDLTLHVFDRAVADAMHWRASGLEIGVAVNVSATLLLDAEFVELLRDRLRSVALPPEQITIEVTESAAMREPERAIAALESWRALGLKISIDDYGTGQSSLGYLQKLPATELKIDMSFVRSLAADRRNAIMVRSTIALAHELGMKVVAEGVEDAECLRLLAAMGCDTAQGWHVGKPMSAEALENFIAGRLRDAA